MRFHFDGVRSVVGKKKKKKRLFVWVITLCFPFSLNSGNPSKFARSEYEGRFEKNYFFFFFQTISGTFFFFF